MRPECSRRRRTIRSVILGAAIAVLAASVVVAAPAADAASAHTAAALPGWLHTSGATIRTATGRAYVIKAVSWTGMETARCAPTGLSAISLDTGLARIASMGFTTVRLPFANSCLAQKTAASIDASHNPLLVGLTPLQVMDVVVARARLYALTIILDQNRPDSSARSALWYTAQFTEKRWISDWKALAKRYSSARNVIGFDLHNVPRGASCWGCGVNALDWRAAATRAGNAVLKINSHVLVIVEGIAKQAASGTRWWSGSRSSVVAKPVALTVKHRVVYSPHESPASSYPKSWLAAKNYPANLPGIWTRNWGYIDKKGIAPVLLGGLGPTVTKRVDKLWLTTLVTYVAKNRTSFAYPAFAPTGARPPGSLKRLLGAATTVPVSQEPILVPTTPPTPPASTLTGSWQLQNSWTGGYAAQLVIASPVDVDGWTATWPDTTTTGITSTWGMACSVVQGESITCSGSDWGAHVAAGYPVVAGLVVTSTVVPAVPTITVR